MAAKRIVLKVDLPCERMQTKALKIIAALHGVNSIAVDIRGQKVTVVGHVDPIKIVFILRRKLGPAEIVSVGEAEEKKPEEAKPKPEPKPVEAQPVKLKPPYFPLSPGAEEFTLEFLNCITNNFSEDRIIGRSRYGAIYKGVQDNGKCIAVMKLLHQKPMLEDEFKNEIRKLTWVRHPNTVQLVGYCHYTTQVSVQHEGEYVSARVEERAVCFEYLQGPTLDKHLSNKPCELHWHTCYMIIRGICEGLHYLHYGPHTQGTQPHTIYHLDLNPTNILLDKYMMPKIGGFGLSRIFASLETDNIASEDIESVYVSPEYINRREISPKFDVFSLGVIIIQIMAGKESYSKCADTSPEEFIQLVHEFWAKRMPETIWSHASSEVRACIEIALKCVKSDLAMRPTIMEIVAKLDINKIYTADQLYYRTREFTLNFLNGITNNFSKHNIVGHGGYGVVYKGVLDNGEEIAVKKFHTMTWIYEDQFKNELNNLTRAQHKNIVGLVGYCHHTDQIVAEYNGKFVSASVDKVALCLEYLQGGSLDKHLSDDEACKLDWETCYRIIKGICEGLDYLHNGSHLHIYHLDLKPENILLDKYMTPKIGDFGLSRLFGSMQTHMIQSVDVKGTRGYMPPEYINKQEISPKFDIFSLGVIIIQMMAGKKAYYDCPYTSPEEFVKLVHGNWIKRLHAITVSCHASQEVMACIKIALRCVETDRGRRPTIKDIVYELTNIGTDESLLKATSEVTSGTSNELDVLRTFGQVTYAAAAVTLVLAIVLTLVQPSWVPPSLAHFHQTAKAGTTTLFKSELLGSAWTGFLAGCLHTLSGPDHLAALAPLSIGRSRVESAAVGALWGCGYDAGQVLFGLLFLGLGDRLNIKVIRTWSTRIVALTLLVIGALGIREASEVPTPCVALDNGGDHGHHPTTGKKKVNFATFATGIVHGLRPDALMMILPALALPSRIAGAAFLGMLLVGTVVSMGSYTVLISSCTEALKDRVPRITEKLMWAASLLAISMGLAILVSQFFGITLY